MLRKFLFLRRRALFADPSLVCAPPGVGTAAVYRNAITEDEEQVIWEELKTLLKDHGEGMISNTDLILKSARTTDTGKDAKPSMQRVVLDMHGGDRGTTMSQLYDAARKKMRDIPGFGSAPFMYDCVSRAAKEAGIHYTIDTMRVNEYHKPGCDMHVDNPSVGQVWGLVSLFSPCVMSFDEESTGRTAQALLPARSMLVLSGELRWGWRHGIQYDTPHNFKGRQVDPEYRLSIVFWKLNKGLINQREVIEAAITNRQKGISPEGEPLLGGDLPSPVKTHGANALHDVKTEHALLKTQLTSLQPKLEQIAKLGSSATPEDAKRIFGISPEANTNDEALREWNKLTEQADYARKKLREMKYTDNPK